MALWKIQIEIRLASPLIRLRGCLHETENEIYFSPWKKFTFQSWRNDMKFLFRVGWSETVY